PTSPGPPRRSGAGCHSLGRRDRTTHWRPSTSGAARPDATEPTRMRALVTGATGLIGAHLVRTLADRGYQVRALVRETSPRDALTGVPAEIVIADVLNAGRDQDAACADCDIVFHAAAH